MRDLNLDSVLATIDEANAADPNRIEDRPRALEQGRRADEWVRQLATARGSQPPPEVRVAARAHHLRRWELARSAYPDGRAGYLHWRRDQKRRHGEDLAAILVAAGWSEPAVDRTRALVERQGLGTDPDVQLVEDAACLVFLETQLGELAGRLEAGKLAGVMARTLAKMSPAAIAAAHALPLSESQRRLLGPASL